MVYNEEIGCTTIVRWENIHAERVEIMTFWISLQKERLRFGFFPLSWRVDPKSTARLGISKWTHHCVPIFSPWIAADEHQPVLQFSLVKIIPEHCILTVFESTVVSDGFTVRAAVTIRVVSDREVIQFEFS